MRKQQRHIPTPKKKRISLVEPEITMVSLPVNHPGSFKKNGNQGLFEPIKLGPIQRKKIKTRVEPRRLSLLVAISHYRRPGHLARCLNSLEENSRVDYRSCLEVLVVDDCSPKEDYEKVFESCRQFVKNTGVSLFLWVGSERVGVARNKNRALWYFQEKTSRSEILLIDDDVLFTYPDWWDRLRDSSDRSQIGVLGIAPAFKDFISKDIKISDLFKNGLEKEPGPPSVHTSKVASPQMVYFRREAVRQVGYVDATAHLYGTEFTEYIKRANRAQGRPDHIFFLIPNMKHALVLFNDPGENWSTTGEKRSFEKIAKFDVETQHLRYRNRGPGYQHNKHHGLINPEFEHSNSLRLEENTESLNIVLPRRVKRTTKFKMEENPIPLVGNEEVTVVIGHRGLERVDLLRHTISSLYGGTIRPKVIVVEQDTFPRCRAIIEPLVDEYIFTFSDRAYNRGWAFNVGAMRSTSAYLLLHDSDLLVPEDYLEIARGLLSKANVAICWGSIAYLNRESSENFPESRKKLLRTITNEGIHGGSTIVQKDWYIEVGGFDERFEGWGAEDDAFYMKARKLGRVVKASPRGGPLLYHLYHGHGVDKHKLWERNKQLWVKYCVSDVTGTWNIIKGLGGIGDPDRGTKLFRDKQSSSSIEVLSRVKHLHVIFDAPGWAYWWRAEYLAKYAPPGWRVTRANDLPRRYLENPPDVVLLLNYSMADRIHRMLRGKTIKTILVGSMNVGWPRRLEYLSVMLSKCHHTIMNNRELFLMAGQLPRTSTISNGVDLRTFRSFIKVDKRPPRILWTGSYFHAQLKGYDILRKLRPRFESLGFDVDLRLVNSHGIKKLNHAQMAEWYNTGSIYIVASESEGTPNPALEAAACGLVLVSTKVGNMPELIVDGENGIILPDRSPKSILDGLLRAKESLVRLSEAMLKTIESWSWERRSRLYFDLFEMLLRGEVPDRNWNLPNSLVLEPEKARDIEIIRSQVARI